MSDLANVWFSEWALRTRLAIHKQERDAEWIALAYANISQQPKKHGSLTYKTVKPEVPQFTHSLNH